MKVKITIPENINDITLGQFQKFSELLKKDLNDYELLTRKISIFTGLTLEQSKELSQMDLESINNDINKALETPVNFVNRFFIDDVEFGFIPNFDKIKPKEYFDLTEYANKEEYLHNLMAVLFRPIIDKGVKESYTITEYKGTEQYANHMKLMPLGAVNGALGFFLTLRNDLNNYIQKYMEVEQAKEKPQVITFLSGGGTQL